METCVFCDLYKTTEFDELVNGCMVITPLNPVVQGHLLVIPVLHVTDAGDNPLITGDAMRTASAIAASTYKSYNLITSAGTEATQTVFHLHIHIIPRYVNDNLKLPWTGQIK